MSGARMASNTVDAWQVRRCHDIELALFWTEHVHDTGKTQDLQPSHHRTWSGRTGGHAENSSKTPVSGGGHGCDVSEKMWKTGGSCPFSTTAAFTVSMNSSRRSKYSSSMPWNPLRSPSLMCMAKFRRLSSNPHDIGL